MLHQFKRNKELLALFEAVDEQGLGLGKYSYAWVIVALKRSGRPREALTAAAEFSKREIKVRTPFSRDDLFLKLKLTPKSIRVRPPTCLH